MMKLTPSKALLAAFCIAGIAISCDNQSDIRVIDVEKYHVRTQESNEQDSLIPSLPEYEEKRRAKSMRELQQRRAKRLKEE
jgi:hypothetical protein